MNDLVIGKVYTVAPPTTLVECQAAGCDLCREDVLSPWVIFYGKRVTVTETGLLDRNGHPAVRVATGPVDWHSRVMVALTDQQVRALGMEPNAEMAYLIAGQVMAADSCDAPIGGVAWPDEIEFGDPFPSVVEMPRQPQEVIPACLLRDTALAPQDRRREDRLRRQAAAKGLQVKKMRGALPRRSGGPYWLQNSIGTAVAGEPWSRCGLSLDAVETALLLAEVHQ